MRRTAAALLVAAVLLAAPVFASHTSQTDRNDTLGSLDVRSVDFNHVASRPRWRFTTFGGWTVGQIWDAGYLMVELDTKGDEGIDHVAVLRSDGRGLVATLYRIRADGRHVAMGGLDAGRAGSRGAWLTIALHKLAIGASRTSYFWSTVTSFTGPPCPRTCLDRVPDEGMVEQPLPGVTPSPSPSPSPTPSPSPSPSLTP